MNKKWYKFFLIGAFALSLFQIIQKYANHLINKFTFDFSWYVVITNVISDYGAWLVLTLWVYRLANKYLAAFQVPMWKTWFTLLLESSLIVLFHVMLTTFFIDIFHYFKLGYISSWLQQNRLPVFVGRGFSSLTEYILYTSFFIAIAYYQRYRQQKRL